jgi:hypothetical protein
MTWLRELFVALLAISVAGCSPAFDWREFKADGNGLVTRFPCRPDRNVRMVVVSGSATRMEVVFCAAGGVTFGLGFLDVADPAQVSAAVDELRRGLLANVQGVQPRFAPVTVAGMTPNSLAQQLAAVGRLPDGRAVQVNAAFFVKGLRVYQATVISDDSSSPVVDVFFAGMKFTP